MSTLYTEDMNRDELFRYLDSYLQIDAFSSFDYSLNGLVVGDPAGGDIERISLAVDASLATFQAAVAQKSDLLLVHHGLYWGAPIAVTGAHFRRIKTLLDAQVSLYAAHLPLDAHPEVGNNAQMAQILGLEDVEAFAPYRGVPIGFKGTFATPQNIQWVCERLGFSNPVVLEHGKEQISSVGIVSGGASDSLGSAIAEDLDLFITGEIKHQAYHEALEHQVNLIGGGHYETEVFGVKALGAHLSERFGLAVSFIDKPTGL